MHVGSHGAGPVWKLKDGSSVMGTMVAQEKSPLSGAVPWLLLQAKNPQGPGVLSGVTYIRRSDTKGGAAQGDCDAAHLGTESRVHYSATYTFYGVAAGPRK